MYAVDGRSIYRERADGTYERRGRLPIPESGVEGVTRRLTTVRPWKTAVEWVVGAFATSGVWPLGGADFLATDGRWLFASGDGGRTWTPTWTLPDSSGPMGVLPTAVCRHEGRVLVGEYPLDGDDDCRLLASGDGGRSWTVLHRFDDVRHVHGVHADPYGGDVWITTGDTDDHSRIWRLVDGRPEVVGGGAQRWRAVDLAFAPDAVLWGVDSVYRTRNHVLRLDRDALATGGDPDPVHVVDESVFYAATLPLDGEVVAAFSTAAESGPDSTAPEAHANVEGPPTARVVIASSATDFSEWTELFRFRRRRAGSDRLDPTGVLPSANAYVYLAADPERGLLVNPFNTARNHGAVYEVPPTALAERIGAPAE